MTGFLDQQSIEIPCPECRKKTSKTIGWINKNSHFTCSCRNVVTLNANQFRNEIRKIEDALKNFGKNLR
jgi:hypothetical protein